MVVADVVKCLMRRDRERGLSAGERKMYLTARQVLVAELSAEVKLEYSYKATSGFEVGSDCGCRDISTAPKVTGKLAVTLGLNMDQMEAVQDIHHQFCNEMMLASQAEGDERASMVESAVKKDVRYMRYVLDEKQYKKYLLLLNTTLLNRGLR